METPRIKYYLLCTYKGRFWKKFYEDSDLVSVRIKKDIWAALCDLKALRLKDLTYKISIVKLATKVGGDPKALFSIATTPRCWGGRYSIPWIALLYPLSCGFWRLLKVRGLGQGCVAGRYLTPYFGYTVSPHVDWPAQCLAQRKSQKKYTKRKDRNR